MALPTTITEQIQRNKRDELSYRIMHPSIVIYNEENRSAIEVPFSSYTSKYKDYLSNIIVHRYLSESDCARYRFRPKSFSYDLYGTTEFWNDLLVLNNYESIREFQPNTVQPVRFYDPSTLKSYLNEILILENRIK